jgi:hypothetical protein
MKVPTAAPMKPPKLRVIERAHRLDDTKDSLQKP